MKPKRIKNVTSNRFKGRIKNYCNQDDLRNDDLSFKDPSELPYSVYIKSAFWQVVRRRILHRDCNQCVICNEDADQVHHRSYDSDVLDGRCDKMLVSLCEQCHDFIEYFPDKSKRSDLKLKDDVFTEMLTIRGRSNTDHEAVPLALNIHCKRNGMSSNIIISKIENGSEYHLPFMLMKLLTHFRVEYRHEIRVAFPIGYEQFNQKSGKTILDLVSNKPIIRLFHLDFKAVIKTTKYCELNLLDELNEVFNGQEFGEIVFT